MIKRIVSLLAAVLVLVSGFAIFAEAESSSDKVRVIDEADIIPDEEEKEILDLVDRISEKRKFDVVILTVDSTDDKDIQDFADDYFDYNGFGYGKNKDGIILVIDNGGGNYWVSASGKGVKIFSNSKIDSFNKSIEDNLRAEDFSSACRTFAQNTDSQIASFKRRPFVLIPIALLIGFIISSIKVSGLKSKHKTVRFKTEAATYQAANSLALIDKNDSFLYSNVSRVPIPTTTSSRGPSSGGPHVSSSGHTHTGGGGSFR